MSDRVTALARVRLFEALATAEVEAIAQRASEVHVETGTEVVSQGDEGTEFLLIVAGALEIRVNGRSVNVLGPGEFLGELALLFEMPRSATAIATEPTALLVVDKGSFTAVLAENPGLRDKVLATVAERVRYT